MIAKRTIPNCPRCHKRHDNVSFVQAGDIGGRPDKYAVYFDCQGWFCTGLTQDQYDALPAPERKVA